MEDRFYSAVHEKPYNHLEEEAFLKEKDPELYRALRERALSLPGELVREYGLDAALYFLKREKAEGKADIETSDSDEDALCGIFRFLGRVCRAFSGGERQEGNSMVSPSAEDEERGREDLFYARCGRAFLALESGHLHLYEADLAKALSFIQKSRGNREERELFLLLLAETVPCLSSRLLDQEGVSKKEGRERIRDLLEQGKAGSEAVIQVMGRVRGRLLVRPEESPEEVIGKGERALREAGLDVSGFRARYIPGKVISFWK